MKTKDAIAHFGSVRALADALGISVFAVYQWGEQVPTHRGRDFQIEVLTGGKLKASQQRQGSSA